MVEIIIVVWMDLNILLSIKERKILSVAKECNRSSPGALMNRVRRWMEEEEEKKKKKRRRRREERWEIKISYYSHC